MGTIILETSVLGDVQLSRKKREMRKTEEGVPGEQKNEGDFWCEDRGICVTDQTLLVPQLPSLSAVPITLGCLAWWELVLLFLFLFIYFCWKYLPQAQENKEVVRALGQPARSCT